MNRFSPKHHWSTLQPVFPSKDGEPELEWVPLWERELEAGAFFPFWRQKWCWNVHFTPFLEFGALRSTLEQNSSAFDTFLDSGTKVRLNAMKFFFLSWKNARNFWLQSAPRLKSSGSINYFGALRTSERRQEPHLCECYGNFWWCASWLQLQTMVEPTEPRSYFVRA